MDVVIKRLSDGEIEVELTGEGHTFYNLIKDYVLADERAEFVAYRIEHPLTKTARLYVRAKRQPEVLLSETAAKLVQDLDRVEAFFRELREAKK
jgi:DNA-directed RNA polymerase subunit L